MSDLLGRIDPRSDKSAPVPGVDSLSLSLSLPVRRRQCCRAKFIGTCLINFPVVTWPVSVHVVAIIPKPTRNSWEFCSSCMRPRIPTVSSMVTNREATNRVHRADGYYISSIAVFPACVLLCPVGETWINRTWIVDGISCVSRDRISRFISTLLSLHFTLLYFCIFYFVRGAL